MSGYWDRVFSAAMEICDHTFNTPANEHPLILSDPQNIGNPRWITVILIIGRYHSSKRTTETNIGTEFRTLYINYTTSFKGCIVNSE